MSSNLSSFGIKVEPPKVVEKKDLGDYDSSAKTSKTSEKKE
eukprot:CAMPEP_0115640710 /NCGR_PEP_ID=MMETSP0272-20121206/35932_1 /TAXON_ID=71861 /ORGANISM="Scrippsiella trochoidea, Strain CCMP3099" /LENGTH=40 /DNA_ID= /DNA_START= /DNA_END= /DNA_ORIENTATION=